MTHPNLDVETLVDEKRWVNLRMAEFLQEKSGWTNPETGEYYPPTYCWHAQLLAKRSDGERFYVDVMVPDEDWGSLETMEPYIEKAFRTLETYRLCDCKAGRPCDRHFTC